MITEINIDDIPNPARKGRSKTVMRDIESFLASDMKCAEICTDGYKSWKSAYCTYKTVIYRMGCAVNVITRNGRLFLIKEDTNA